MVCYYYFIQESTNGQELLEANLSMEVFCSAILGDKDDPVLEI